MVRGAGRKLIAELRREISNLRRQLLVTEHEAYHDKLTDCYSAGFIKEELRRYFGDDRLEALSILFIDLNGFKPVNDTFGHPVGDQCLVAVAEALEGAVRYGDAVGRYGGDEFLVILPNAGPPDVITIARRVREACSAIRIPVVGREPISLSVSVGCASRGTHLTAEELLAEADRQMYAVKRASKSARR